MFNNNYCKQCQINNHRMDMGYNPHSNVPCKKTKCQIVHIIETLFYTGIFCIFLIFLIPIILIAILLNKIEKK